MVNRFVFHLQRLRERLWLKPLLYCALAVAAVFVAHLADFLAVSPLVPEVSQDTTEKLLTIISSTMLAVATFAVGSMVSAYASASSAATPRVFALILADDVSQTALSSFIGAFIFSIVAIVALKTGLYGTNGSFVLFVLTIGLFAWVIATFVRWVDNIARLGRIGNTIDKAEAATRRALMRRRAAPNMDCAPWGGEVGGALAVHADRIGYVQLVDAPKLQEVAEELDAEIFVAAEPGAFLTPDRPIAHVALDSPPLSPDALARIRAAFLVGDERTFEADPRFGLIVLSEIAAKALSPAVNDPGTAIVIVGRLVRLLADWGASAADGPPEVKHDRVRAPALSAADLFDDAFTPIARDGAGVVELGVRLQKAFLALEAIPNEAVRAEARRHAQLALDRAEAALALPEDLERLRALARRPV